MIKDLEAALGYKFQNITLLQNALTHSSYANERWHNSLLSNERLEFLGDSVLGMLVADYLYRTFPNRPEGELTRMRADMVCETTLANAANVIGIGEHLLLGHGEERFGGRNRNSILADAMESVIAAAFLDGGIAAAKGIVEKFVLTEVPVHKLHNADYKTALQELVQQKKNQVLSYALVDQSGPDHDKQFEVQVTLNGDVVGKGIGSSKKRAEQSAAASAIEKLFPNKKVVSGRIASSDKFVGGQNAYLKDEVIALGASCVEMESGAIAHVALLNNVSYIAVRTISDSADGEAPDSFAEFCADSAHNAEAWLIEFIK